MSRLVPFLLVGLLLSTTACKKENQPSLEGRWTKQRGTATRYDERNQLVATTEVPGTYSIEITGQTFQYYRGDGVKDGAPYAYTRRGNAVIFTDFSNPNGELTITKLTEHELTLHFEAVYRPSTAGGRTNSDQYLTR